MRLINTKTGLFEEFTGRKIPKYAILSHTWDDEEVSFQDTNDPSHRGKKGWQKIRMTCEIARRDKLDYCWIDTSCIDKSSSAELSEAINSMYQWYRRSEICYAFLSDLPESATLDTDLKNCRWFTRGWTLQELIAPEIIHFYDQSWKFRGSKDDLIFNLSSITGISQSVLWRRQPLSSIAVAQKMSWAAYRETTRIEDTAYCLLGIFDVNMALLYGEEEKAFLRLQEEIIKSTADLSIFAWSMPPESRPPDGSRNYYCGVLAETPLWFANCASFQRRQNFSPQEFSISNIGIKTKAPILLPEIPGAQRCQCIFSVDCFHARTTKQIFGISVKMCGLDQYMRENPWDLVKSTAPLQRAPRERYLLTKIPGMNSYSTSQILDIGRFIASTRSHVLQISCSQNISFEDQWPNGRYDYGDKCFFVSWGSNFDFAAIRLRAFHQSPEGRQSTIEFPCMFYAIGWSALDTEPQCTLLAYKTHSAPLDELQAEIETWDPTTSRVAGMVNYLAIPKCSSATYEMPGTKESIFVSFTLSLKRDINICPNEFWRVKIFSDICKSKRIPRINNHEWNLRRLSEVG